MTPSFLRTYIAERNRESAERAGWRPRSGERRQRSAELNGGSPWQNAAMRTHDTDRAGAQPATPVPGAGRFLAFARRCQAGVPRVPHAADRSDCRLRGARSRHVLARPRPARGHRNTSSTAADENLRGRAGHERPPQCDRRWAHCRHDPHDYTPADRRAAVGVDDELDLSLRELADELRRVDEAGTADEVDRARGQLARSIGTLASRSNRTAGGLQPEKENQTR